MPGPLVCDGAMVACDFGDSPMPLDVMPPTPFTVNGMPVATIMHFVPELNIPSFIMCNTPSNPEVAAATAAALGVLTPMPCIPMTTSPWVPGAEICTAAEIPLLDESCICMCDWGGTITVVEPGQFQAEVA